ncbi:MAG: hypothetical protein JOY96_04875 [Verrucomicrobia bacterium]|nr:hypothetical protein [Verrucomicrobiota bacterium]
MREITMLQQMVLETEGFRFAFHVDYGRTDQQYLGMTVTFQLLSPLPEMTLSSERTSIAVADLHHLLEYFEQHMTRLKEKNGDAEADVFLNWELGFQLQALAGNVEPPMDEMFSIRCLLNVGKGKNGHRVYVGGESDVTFEQARAFMRDIQSFIDELPNLHFEVVFEEPDPEELRRIADASGYEQQDAE